MTKIFCDCCGKEIERIKTDYTRMAFGSNIHAEEKHFHIECAVRINNLIDSFCHANGGRKMASDLKPCMSGLWITFQRMSWMTWKGYLKVDCTDLISRETLPGV